MSNQCIMNQVIWTTTTRCERFTWCINKRNTFCLRLPQLGLCGGFRRWNTFKYWYWSLWDIFVCITLRLFRFLSYGFRTITIIAVVTIIIPVIFKIIEKMILVFTIKSLVLIMVPVLMKYVLMTVLPVNPWFIIIIKTLRIIWSVMRSKRLTVVVWIVIIWIKVIRPLLMTPWII